MNEELKHYGVPGMRWGVISKSKKQIVNTKTKRKKDERDDDKAKEKSKQDLLKAKQNKDKQELNDAKKPKQEDKKQEQPKSDKPKETLTDSQKVAALKNKPMSEISTKELKEANERARLEREYKDNNTSAGAKFAKQVLREASKDALKNVTTKLMTKGLEWIIGKSTTKVSSIGKKDNSTSDTAKAAAETIKDTFSKKKQKK